MKKSFIVNHVATNLKPLERTFLNSVKRAAKNNIGNFDKFEHEVREYADKLGYCVSTFVDEAQLRVATDENLNTDDFIIITLK